MPGQVTVACKLPHGLRLRLFRMEEQHEPVMGGGTRLVQHAMPIGESVVLNGNAFAFGEMPEFAIVGGYALTPGVDADFFDAWLKQNATLEVVTKKLVFAHLKDTAGLARENKDRKSGLERLDPDRPGSGLEPFTHS